MIVLAITTILAHFNIVLGDGQVQSVVTDILDLAGIIMSVWGQLRRSDLKMGLIRK